MVPKDKRKVLDAIDLLHGRDRRESEETGEHTPHSTLVRDLLIQDRQSSLLACLVTGHGEE